MDKDLIDKYFRDECSEEELDKVLAWFQTDEGREFLENDFENHRQRIGESKRSSLKEDIDSKAVFNRIQSDKKKKRRRNFWTVALVASFLLIAFCFSAVLYWGGINTESSQDLAKDPLVYTTTHDQHKVLGLADGTTVRLNENSKLVVPQENSKKRIVRLTGEAYFEVAHNSGRPFIVNTEYSSIEVLGTKFNVKADTLAGNVEVAVTEGKVSLKKERTNDVGAILTKNHFGILDTRSNDITIEEANVDNYMSWIDNRLAFNGESLFEISRQLERLYDVEIQFKNERLKSLNLTADFERSSLTQVLTVIANTLEINYRTEEDRVTWTR